MKQTTLTFALLLLGVLLWAQQPPATAADERINSFKDRQALEAASIVNGIEFESIGPTVFSGRVADLDVWEEDPSHFYVAYASGGVWKTENNGTTFTPLFDNEMVMTIGDIAVDWKNDIIWVGTGEVNSSRSSYSGVGLYKSMDGGKNWEYLGLPESHHIGRIILHPDKPDVAWVAVLGHLYSPNEERGVYKTTDGGKNWEKVLYVNPNAGAVDMVIDPDNPDVLYAATWERTRRAWDFTEAGSGSGIHKTTDGGESWTKISTDKSGFPNNEGAGRIGLAITSVNGKTKLYATIDNYNRRPEEEKEDSDELTKDMLREMSAEDFSKLKDYQIEGYLRQNGFPREYNLKKVKAMVKSGEITPLALVEYIEDANSLLFDTPVVGLEVYVSDDEGKRFRRTHEDYLDAVYYTYGYYFGQVRVDPSDANRIYLLGVPVIKSTDGGKTFAPINGDNVHSDHHALWINPARPGHLVLGNDGGVNISYDDGESYIKCNSPALGQFYYIAVDMAKPYNVYGGLQDNGVWFGPNTYKASNGWQGSGQYPYRSIMGGDGMQVAVDIRDNATVYTGYQFGNYYRLNTKTNDNKYITPRHKLGERPLRWNWQTPVHLSVHNQDILYMGSNKVHRSFDQGDTFTEISDDLTKGGRKGDVAFGTLTTLHESPLRFGLLYAGSDDGRIHVTKDGGVSWTEITDGLPEDMWVVRIQASAFAEGRVYAALNGYRWDDFTPYLYVSDDYGQNWKAIGKDLPLEPLNVVKEDPDNENLLYVGSDHGLYVSMNRGESFMLLNNGLPAVAVHDVVIHPREKDILVGTHGRSIYKGSATALQQLNEELMAKGVHVFAVDPVRQSGFWGRQWASWSEARSPELKIPFYVKEAGKVKLTIATADGMELKQTEMDAQKGLQHLSYDLSFAKNKAATYEKFLNKDKKETDRPAKVKAADNGLFYLQKGKYELTLEKGGETSTTTLEIK